MLIHNVYFTLIDNSEEKIQILLNDADKFLRNAPGLTHFAIGRRGQEFTRDVSDQEFDVCLNVVFTDKQAHDTYQVSDNHIEFVTRNKPNFKKLRVCDAYTL